MLVVQGHRISGKKKKNQFYTKEQSVKDIYQLFIRDWTRDEQDTVYIKKLHANSSLTFPFVAGSNYLSFHQIQVKPFGWDFWYESQFPFDLWLNALKTIANYLYHAIEKVRRLIF